MKKINTQQGFTLVEIIISVGLFAIVITIALGGLLEIINVNREVQGSRTTVDNLDNTLELMTREISRGSLYACGYDTGYSTVDTDCVDDEISFRSRSGSYVHYKLNDGIIERAEDALAYTPVTAEAVDILALSFSIYGNEDSGKQPKVFVTVRGEINSPQGTSSTFALQTTLSQSLGPTSDTSIEFEEF